MNTDFKRNLLPPRYLKYLGGEERLWTKVEREKMKGR